jgi:hypothetical protein
MAIDRTYPRLFSACRSGVIAILDYLAGKVVATVPIDDWAGGRDGRGPPVASTGPFLLHQTPRARGGERGWAPSPFGPFAERRGLKSNCGTSCRQAGLAARSLLSMTLIATSQATKACRPAFCSLF